MFDFIFRYFLVLPKIQFYGNWGILIGEITLFFFLIYSVIVRKKIVVNSLIVSYYSFVIYFTIISSAITAFIFGFFPMHASLYVSRLLLCSGLFIWAYGYYQKHDSNASLVKMVFNRPFIVHFFIGLVIMAAYYSTHSPTSNYILWGYEVGLRMIPLAGLVIDFDSFFFLKAVSGSGNLLAGWALVILILNFNLGKGKQSKWIISIAILTVLLTLSRGGFLTIVLYLTFVGFKTFNFRFSIKTVLAGIIFFAGLAFYFSLSKETPLPNIFERLTITYEDGGFDGSTQGRLNNYMALLNVWVTKWNYIIFGFGFDEQALLATSNQTVVESYFLEVLVCSGLIGFFLFTMFYVVAFLTRNKNYWFKCLWEFLFFQSIVQWTVTGGDFLAPHATYIFLTLIGFGLASSHRQLVNSNKVISQ